MPIAREVTHEFSVLHLARAGDARAQRARAQGHCAWPQRGRTGLLRRCAVRRREPFALLQKISELYDRVGFAAAGKFNEFDNLRRGGIQFADTRGYAYDRRDVTGRQLANVYAQTLGTIFTEQAKPYEVELCVAEVAHHGETKSPELYRITYDGSIADEPDFVVMGGTTEPIATALKDSYAENADLADAVHIAVNALKAGGGNGSDDDTLSVTTLEVAILDASRPRRAFRRITGAALERLLPEHGFGSRTIRRRNRRSRLCPVLIGLSSRWDVRSVTARRPCCRPSDALGELRRQRFGSRRGSVAQGAAAMALPVGIGLDGLGFLLQIAAFGMVPIYVVAAAIAASLAVTAIVAAWVLSTRLSAMEWAAVAVVCASLAMLGVAAGPEGTGHGPPGLGWALLVIAALVFAAGAVAGRLGDRTRALVLGFGPVGLRSRRDRRSADRLDRLTQASFCPIPPSTRWSPAVPPAFCCSPPH